MEGCQWKQVVVLISDGKIIQYHKHHIQIDLWFGKGIRYLSINRYFFHAPSDGK